MKKKQTKKNTQEQKSKSKRDSSNEKSQASEDIEELEIGSDHGQKVQMVYVNSDEIEEGEHVPVYEVGGNGDQSEDGKCSDQDSS